MAFGNYSSLGHQCNFSHDNQQRQATSTVYCKSWTAILLLVDYAVFLPIVAFLNPALRSHRAVPAVRSLTAFEFAVQVGCCIQAENACERWLPRYPTNHRTSEIEMELYAGSADSNYSVSLARTLALTSFLLILILTGAYLLELIGHHEMQRHSAWTCGVVDTAAFVGLMPNWSGWTKRRKLVSILVFIP